MPFLCIFYPFHRLHLFCSNYLFIGNTGWKGTAAFRSLCKYLPSTGHTGRKHQAYGRWAPSIRTVSTVHTGDEHDSRETGACLHPTSPMNKQFEQKRWSREGRKFRVDNGPKSPNLILPHSPIGKLSLMENFHKEIAWSNRNNIQLFFYHH